MWGHLPHTDEIFEFFDRVGEHVGEVNSILEFGTNMCYSATVQLEVFKNATIHTYDPRTWGVLADLWRWPEPRPIENMFFNKKMNWVDLAKLVYGERFQFYKQSSIDAISMHDKGDFDYAFVDGNHGYEMAKTDIVTCLQLEIPWILVDNTKVIVEVAQAIKEFPHLELVDEIEYTQHYPFSDEIKPETMSLYKSNYEQFLL